MAFGVEGGTLFKTRPHRIDFEMLVRLSSEAVLVVSPSGELVFASAAAEKLFGWGKDDLSAQLADLVDPASPGPEAGLVHDILTGNSDADAQLQKGEVRLRSSFGPLVWTEAAIHPVTDADGSARAHALYFRNIARQKELEGLLEAAGQTDPLTGLYNRRAFENSLKREWAIALRDKVHTTLIKVFLDRFDTLIEQSGLDAGNDCLTKVAQALRETARRPADIVARTSSSEFALLLPRTHEMGAETISAYVRLAIADLMIPAGGASADNTIITASIGSACTVANQAGISDSADVLLTAAENCVFKARQEGGNRVKSIVKALGN